jgi:adenylate kinase family enzyme
MQHQRRFVVDPPRRVLALGSPGSGRSDIVELISARFHLPIVSLDREKATTAGDTAVWRQRISDLAQGAAWAMVGADAEALEEPLRLTDWLIFLDLPMSLCFARVVRAALRGTGSSEVESGVWRAIREVWQFPTDMAPHIAQAIERERRNRTIFILHSKREVGRFLAKLPDADDSSRESSSGDAPQRP